ncbi:hypothetical protein Aph01nite_64050 [Acrocarpospora phusangensis]|uniref:Iminophenyl-pyruvate dimer synthase domain-containing protein n=1 Tax=Acrocarpospora phusangensis TaxID=1070424 RepID=A0A919QIL9_9ACTN|nr:ferritin-like domain-containing protein [Acrocarpospora phusangensis]GIH28095.1 hypothetical protein Aph01nite_64050 [Acrocarpospora phusangensis]
MTAAAITTEHPQRALELEHATLPPYLCALHSLDLAGVLWAIGGLPVHRADGQALETRNRKIGFREEPPESDRS